MVVPLPQEQGGRCQHLKRLSTLVIAVSRARLTHDDHRIGRINDSICLSRAKNYINPPELGIDPAHECQSRVGRRVEQHYLSATLE